KASEQDVFAFYFDEPARKWRAVGRIGPNVETGETAGRSLTSITEHFTDFVNATRPIPEHPVQQLFDPNSIKGLKAADPSAGVAIIQAPIANSTGSAILGYALELPPTRHVAVPKLIFNYDSDRPNGWMGVGWNLDFSAIEVDTRFGVPLYDGTEIYLLGGEMLSGPDPT